MPDDFEYVSQSRLEYRHGSRHAYLGEIPAPVVYGVQGKLREYYGRGGPSGRLHPRKIAFDRDG